MSATIVHRYECDFCAKVEDNPKPGTWRTYEVHERKNGFTGESVKEYNLCTSCHGRQLDQGIGGFLRRITGRSK
jgi:hypothetical protein